MLSHSCTARAYGELQNEVVPTFFLALDAVAVFKGLLTHTIRPFKNIFIFLIFFQLLMEKEKN